MSSTLLFNTPSVLHNRHMFRGNYFPTVPSFLRRRFFAPFRAALSTRRYTPQDILTFRRSRFAYVLTDLRKRGGSNDYEPDPPSPIDEALTHHGIVHEQEIVDELIRTLSAKTQLSESELLIDLPRNSLHETISAIQRRVPVIRNPTFQDDKLSAAADLLLRADLDPHITEFQRQRASADEYVVIEVKLSSMVTADHAFQAAAYVHMLDNLRGLTGARSANWAYVSAAGHRKRLRTTSLRLLWSRGWADFSSFVARFDGRIPLPEGTGDEVKPWKEAAKEILEEKDSLSLIAGIRRSEIKKIIDVLGVQTVEEFSELEEDELLPIISSGQLGEGYIRLLKQAKMQIQSRINGKTAYSVVENAATLPPEHKEEDVMFDMEGFPLEKGGLEYLFGAVSDGEFHYWWAHNRQEEEQAFIGFVEWLRRKWNTKPGVVYHYGHYEVTALRKVGLRAETARGIAAARWLENTISEHRFVDIYKTVKACMVLGEPNYSIKSVEKILGVSREDKELADAESSVGMYHQWRIDSEKGNLGDGEKFENHPILSEILSYNEQDCRSLGRLVSWLRTALPEGDLFFSDQSKNEEKDDSKQTGDKQKNNDQNVSSTDIAPGACGPSQQHKLVDSMSICRSLDVSQDLLRLTNSDLDVDARHHLCHLLHFYVRESLPVRMEFSNRIYKASGPDYNTLLEDDECLSSLVFVGEQREETKRGEKLAYLYNYPQRQPTSIAAGSGVAIVSPTKERDGSTSQIASFGSIKSIYPDSSSNMGCVRFSVGRNKDFAPPTYAVLVSSDELRICDAPLRQSILRSTERMLSEPENRKTGLIKAFLQRTMVDEEAWDGDLSTDFKNLDTRPQCVAKFLATREKPCVFVLQGPPGSGKTSLSGKVISDLVMKHGKTVAVSSNSHAAIDNLLNSAVCSGTHSMSVVKVGKKSSHTEMLYKLNVRDVDVLAFRHNDSEFKNTEMQSSENTLNSPRRKRRSRKSVASLVGATCYQLAREESEEKFDFLFVDEASQVTTANFLAMAPCAKYAVLVGDQQQLEMPIRGSHPTTVKQSCLSYIVNENETAVGPSRGLFLDQSYRMNPKICSFISDLFYENALGPAENCKENRVELKGSKSRLLSRGEGIVFIGCFSPSEEQLVDGGTNVHGRWHKQEEIEVIKKVIDELLGCTYTVNKRSHKLDECDILVVAPYNAQVRALRQSLQEGIRVGTVDKFQGQEAAVAIISTCTSGLSDDCEQNEDYEGYGDVESLDGSLGRSGHRGVHFSLQRNRLNVAISRGQCLSVIIGDENLVGKIPLRTLEDIEIAGLYEQIVVEGRQ